MARSSLPLCRGALLCFVLAESVSAHPRQPLAIDVRLVGAPDGVADRDNYATGKRLLAGGDVASALAAFRLALAASPESADANNGIGVCFDQLGRHDLAQPFYLAGLAIDPSSPQLLNNLGYSRVLAGDTAGAIAPLRAAAASGDPDASATAAATLTRLTSAERPVDYGPAIGAVTTTIEPTSETEQRLVVAHASAPSQLGDAASITQAVPGWTAADDDVLLAQVDADSRAEAEASAAAPRMVLAVAEPPRTDPVLVATGVAAAAPPRIVATRPLAVAQRQALVLSDGGDKAVDARRRAASGGIGSATSSGFDPNLAAADFDSDDAMLNAFARRVVREADLARMSRAPEAARIAERFRA